MPNRRKYILSIHKIYVFINSEQQVRGLELKIYQCGDLYEGIVSVLYLDCSFSWGFTNQPAVDLCVLLDPYDSISFEFYKVSLNYLSDFELK